MNYISTLLTVSDLERSRKFYQDVLGLQVTADFGANVVLDGRIALQTLETWEDFIHTREIAFRHNAGELYFEEADMDAFLRRLEGFSIELVHPLKTHRWGQRVIRFYDPDHHIIEVGEDMRQVVRRFQASGMTREQIAARMDVPLSYVRACLEAEAPAGENGKSAGETK